MFTSANFTRVVLRNSLNFFKRDFQVKKSFSYDSKNSYYADFTQEAYFSSAQSNRDYYKASYWKIVLCVGSVIFAVGTICQSLCEYYNKNDESQPDRSINGAAKLTDQVEDGNKKIKFATWNVDANFKVETNFGDLFSSWKVKNRICDNKEAELALNSKFTDFLNMVAPDILHLQELRKTEEGINSLDPMIAFLEENHYKVVVCSYNQAEGVNSRAVGDEFKYITAYKVDCFEPLEDDYITFAPINNERCVLITKIKHKATGERVCTFNVHIHPAMKELSKHHVDLLKCFSTKPKEMISKLVFSGTSVDLVREYIKEDSKSKIIKRAINKTKDLERSVEYAREDSKSKKIINSKTEDSQHIVDLVKEYIKEDPKIKIIIAGDFNSFSDEGANQQMNPFNDQIREGKSLQNLTSKLVLSDNKNFPENEKTTFFYYPYDNKSQKVTDEIKEKYKEWSKDNPGKIKSEFWSQNRRGDSFSDYLKENFKAIGGHLDHIFTYNFSVIDKSVPVLEVSPQFKLKNSEEHKEARPEDYIEVSEPGDYKEVLKDYTEEEIKKYIINNIGKGPAFLSDHQLIWVYLSLIGENPN